MASPEDEIPEGNNPLGNDEEQDNTDLFDIDDQDKPKKKEEPVPLYRVYKGSKIAVSKSTGKMWRNRYDAAIAAYDTVLEMWNQAFAYYNNNHGKELQTPRGVFKRGDSTENIVYSNLNVMLPAVYSKDPDITCNTNDEGDKDFVKALQSLLNAFIKRRNLLNAKSKFKRAVGFGLLTNFGVLKIDWTKKEDSIELANEELARISEKIRIAKNSQELEMLYGELSALESTMEIFEKSGPKLKNVLSHNLVIDPYAEDTDGMDSGWMIERCFLPTDFLRAKYTEPCDGEEDDPKSRRLVYKPTHKASFDNSGKRDDGLGMVLDALDAGTVTEYQDEERQGYTNMYYTECFIVWDKQARRVFLFHSDDWTWPLWVWDDPLNISRFFPYFIISFGMSTGGTVSVGETSYYLDQQDEINDINRQVARIRRTVFDFFYYNSDATNKDEVEKFVNAIRGYGDGGNADHLVGVRAGEGKITDMIQAFVPPQLQAEALFNKEPILNTINRISNTSDALRGTQFKTNTNQAAVESYQDAARMAVGAKIDVVEDVIADIANSFAEIAVQMMDEDQVAGLIGPALAKGWQQMTLQEFMTNYNVDVVAGTTEKKNSVYKKKEAVQIAQAIGQFASAAPITSMKIMLKVLEQAFSEVVVQPEDWDQLEQEALAQQRKGDSTGGQTAEGQGGGASGGGGLQDALMNLPDDVKQQALQMKNEGKSEDEIKQFLMSKVQGGGGGAPPAGPQAPQPAPQA